MNGERRRFELVAGSPMHADFVAMLPRREPYIIIAGRAPEDPQVALNRAWRWLGERMGFHVQTEDTSSVTNLEQHPDGTIVFYAVPLSRLPQS